jgi:hypothetical protein
MQPSTMSHENVPDWFQNSQMASQSRHPQAGYGHSAGAGRVNSNARGSGAYHHPQSYNRKEKSAPESKGPEHHVHGPNGARRTFAVVPNHRPKQLYDGRQTFIDTSLPYPQRDQGGTGDDGSQGSVHRSHGRAHSIGTAEPRRPNASTDGPGHGKPSAIMSIENASAPPIQEEEKKNLSKSAKAKLRKKKREGKV